MKIFFKIVSIILLSVTLNGSEIVKFIQFDKECKEIITKSYPLSQDLRSNLINLVKNLEKDGKQYIEKITSMSKDLAIKVTKVMPSLKEKEEWRNTKLKEFQIAQADLERLSRQQSLLNASDQVLINRLNSFLEPVSNMAVAIFKASQLTPSSSEPSKIAKRYSTLKTQLETYMNNTVKPLLRELNINIEELSTTSSLDDQKAEKQWKEKLFGQLSLSYLTWNARQKKLEQYSKNDQELLKEIQSLLEQASRATITLAKRGKLPK